MTLEVLLMGLAAFAAVMLENVLRASQSKNVNLGLKKAVFFTGGLMTLCDGVVMTIIAKGGLEMLPFTVTASAFGWILGVHVHDRLTESFRKKIADARKERKRLKRKRRLSKAVQKELLKQSPSDAPGAIPATQTERPE